MGIENAATIKRQNNYLLILEDAIAQVSKHFLLPPDQVNLNQVLEIVGKSISANYVCIFQFVNGQGSIGTRYQWRNSDAPPLTECRSDLDPTLFPELTRRLEFGENIQLPHMEGCPLEAASEKKHLQIHQNSSLLMIPCHSTTKKLFGFICLEDAKGDRAWLDIEVLSLRTIAEMLSIHWERKQTKSDLERSEGKYKKLYEESKKTEELYRSLIYSSADAVILYDMNGKATYTNPEFTSLFGWTADDSDKKWMPPFPEPEREATMTLINDIIEKGKSIKTFRTKRYTKDERLLDVSISASRFNNHKGVPTGILCVLRDISENKKLEAQLIQAQKMEAIGVLAGGIAHDFNNIIQAILGCTEMMLMTRDQSHPDYDMLMIIEQSAQKASELTKRLLIFGRQVGGDFEPVDLNSAVVQVSKILERTIPKMIKIELDLEESLSGINGDLVQIEQILMNLGVNARDAMPDGGTLTFHTTNVTFDESDSIGHFELKPGDYVLMRISDTGHGIDKAITQHIFEPFFTTKEKGHGTGLGLAMVYGIVKRHGGYITCYSEVGHGTIFNIYLPVLKNASIKAPPTVRETSLRGGDETILLVDDDEPTLEIGEEILKSFGYNVIVVSDGEKAIEYYHANKEMIDLVILDLIMPGIGGRKCVEDLIALDLELKVIISSGYAMNESIQQAMDRGAIDFISKPYEIKKMFQVVRKALD